MNSRFTPKTINDEPGDILEIKLNVAKKKIQAKNAGWDMVSHQLKSECALKLRF